MNDGLTESDRQGIQAALRELPKIRRAVLFGSRAMGTFRGASDVDLALEGDDISLDDLLSLQAKIANLNLPIEVDLVIRDKIKDPDVVEHIKQHGRVWFQGFNQFPDGWKLVKFGDLAAPKRNAIVGGPFGSNLVSNDYTPNGIPVIRGQNMSQRWVGGEFVFVNDVKATELAANLACPGDLVFTQRGTLGQVAIVPSVSWSKYLISQSQMKATVDPEKADPLFLYYYFSSEEQQQWIHANATQTGVPHTNLGTLRVHPVLLPPLPEQRAIAGVLGAMDDKIELNRRTSRTLERVARAIFRAWFVDFEPVKAKAAGAKSFPGMPQQTFDTLSARLVPSELGPIPEGWEVKTLGDLLIFAYGKALKAENRVTGPIPVYGSNGQVGWHNTALVERAGIVIGRKGNPGTIERVGGPFFPIDTTFYVEPTETSPPATYLFYLLESLDLPRLSADSAVPGLNRNAAYAEHCLVPPDLVCDRFSDIIESLWNAIEQSKSEICKLAELRDYLLPKLLSGAVRVNQAWNIIREAAS